MGLARLHQVESSADDLTASGVTLGTFDYISPEQARDPRAADVRSDIYSLGCTLFYMLTGQPPFPDGTVLQKLLRHNSDEPPDVRQFRPELSPRVAALLAKSARQAAVAAAANRRGVDRRCRRDWRAAWPGERGRVRQILVMQPPAASPWWSKAWQALAAVALLILAMVAMEMVLSPRHAGGGMVLPAQFKDASDTTAAQATPVADGVSSENRGDESDNSPMPQNLTARHTFDFPAVNRLRRALGAAPTEGLAGFELAGPRNRILPRRARRPQRVPLATEQTGASAASRSILRRRQIHQSSPNCRAGRCAGSSRTSNGIRMDAGRCLCSRAPSWG